MSRIAEVLKKAKDSPSNERARSQESEGQSLE